jgi:hypothetical protein
MYVLNEGSVFVVPSIRNAFALGRPPVTLIAEILAGPPVERQGRSRGGAVRRVRAGHEQRELEKLAPVERQALDLLLVDDAADRRAHRVEQRHRLAHDDIGRDGARAQ